MLFLSKHNKLNRKWAFGICKIQLVVRTLQINFFLIISFLLIRNERRFFFQNTTSWIENGHLEYVKYNSWSELKIYSKRKGVHW